MPCRTRGCASSRGDAGDDRQPRRVADDGRRAICLNSCARAAPIPTSRSRCTCPTRRRPADAVEPEHEALLADAVGLALLIVLDTLTPAERLAFVLHDMFAVPFEEIATDPRAHRPTATRQLASRARRRVQGARRAPDADRPASARSSTRSSRRRARRLRRPRRACSTPTWSCAPTRASPARRACCEVRARWPTTPWRSRPARAGPVRRWSTGRPASSSPPTANRSPCSRSLSPRAGSWPSRRSPTRRTSSGSSSRSWTTARAFVRAFRAERAARGRSARPRRDRRAGGAGT